MICLAAGISAVYFLIELVIRKQNISPMILFSALWFSIIILSGIRLYGLNPTSDFTYLIIFVGLLFWGIGYYSNSFFFLQTASINKYKLHRYVVCLLALASIFFCFKDFVKVLPDLLNGENLAQIRLISQDNTSILYQDVGNIENAIRSFIIYPFMMAFQPIVALEFWKGNRKWLYLDILIIVFRVLSQGSRIIFIYLLIDLILFYGITSKNKVIKEYFSRKNIAFLVIIGIVAIIWTTYSRSGDRAFRSTYYYYSMEPYMMNEWIGQIKGWGFGTASFNGLVYPVIYFFKNVLHFISDYPSYWYNNIFLLINNTDKIWLTISSWDYTQANAYVSVFWAPFVDGGFIAEGIIMFIYGSVVQHYYQSVYVIKNAGDREKCIYALLLQGLLFSFVRFQFADITYVLSFVWIILLYRKINEL